MKGFEAPDEPTRQEIDALPGLVLLEFGAGWCSYCRALAPVLQTALGLHPEVRHIRIEDGPGKPLGRSFRVRLWPTLIFLCDGAIVHQIARPDAQDVAEGFEALAEASRRV